MSRLLRGHIALVTGGGGGIGRAICEQLAASGATVVVADYDEAAAHSAASEINAAGRSRATAARIDVTKDESITGSLATLAEVGHRPDILVNSAGIFDLRPLEALDPATWDRMIDVNFKGAFRMTKAALPWMLERNWGRIVSIASGAGKTGEAYSSHYSASKRALIAMSQSLALEVAPAVTVNCVCPGLIATAMTTTEVAFRVGAGELPANVDPLEWMEARIPMRRVGRPLDVANAVRWLCSDDASYVTGQAINVDGGLEFH